MGVIRYENEEWCKIWNRIDLPFQNWQGQFNKFWPEHSKNLKNLHFNRLLLTKVNNVWAEKSIEELFLIALNIDAKFEGKMTCAFKNDMRNLANFHQSMFGSLKIGTLMGSFYSK